MWTYLSVRHLEGMDCEKVEVGVPLGVPDTSDQKIDSVRIKVHGSFTSPEVLTDSFISPPVAKEGLDSGSTVE